MVALVDVPAGLGGERVDGVELEDVDAGVAQALEEFLRRAERADAVVDQIDLDALRLLGDAARRRSCWPTSSSSRM